MARLLYLNLRGHTELSWDVQRAHAGDAEALAAVDEAERLLQEALQNGYTAFTMHAGVVRGRVGTISTVAADEDVMLIPPMAGG